MFQFSERHIEEYQSQGYTVFRGVVPSTLLVSQLAMASGNYVTYRKRATLHEGVMTAKFQKWIEETMVDAGRRIQEGADWENPNQAQLAA